MRAGVEVANIQPELIASRNNYQTAITRLRTVLGLDRDTEIEVSGEFRYVPDKFEEMSLPDIQDMALANRPEILALEEQKDMARQGIVIARSNFLPKLMFTTNYSFLSQKNDLTLSQEDFSEGLTSGLNLQIPLFHGFRSRQQYQKAKLDYKMTLDGEKQTLDQVAGEAEFAFNKFAEARETFLSASETVEMAEEALRLANLQYEEGSNTQLDVLSSQLALTQARMNYVRSIYQYQLARYGLRRITGQLEGAL
jgi:outer membrane protein TolC